MRLKKIDLTKAKEHSFPGARTRTWYLAKLKFDEDRKAFYQVGQFSRQWYGLNFDCDWGESGIQFDAPGTNCSPWVGLWEIVDK